MELSQDQNAAVDGVIGIGNKRPRDTGILEIDSMIADSESRECDSTCAHEECAPADAGAGSGATGTSDRLRRNVKQPSKFAQDHEANLSPMDFASNILLELLELELDVSKRLEVLQNAMERFTKKGFTFLKNLFTTGMNCGIFPPTQILVEIDNNIKEYYGIHGTLNDEEWGKLPFKYEKMFTESGNKHLQDFHEAGPKYAEMILKFQFQTEGQRTNNVQKFYDDLWYSNVIWLTFLLLID